MKFPFSVGQASRLSHSSNQPLERKTVFKKLETGAPPVLLWLVLLSTLNSQLSTAHAQQYSDDWYKIAGGGGTSTNGIYSVSGTIGQPDVGGSMSGGNFSVTGGFWSLVSVVQTLGAPTLKMTLNSQLSTINISWPSSSTGFVLQQNSNLATTNWTTSGLSISDDGTNKSITIGSPTGNLFFRLAHP